MSNRLKSLELVGYKTFARKTLFEFSGNITAVIGPNGSGKSNIADALRWVLGEQSYSLLRGRKTDDMIFSGSEKRARASMASATVTFDNTDGWLPIDFTEVSITRRAYRDGKNEYLINNQKVRLLDVTDLLSKSGLSERSYTVIGQGMVDAALALKAVDRRKLFEEAAGIRLYRKRKEQAVRRLDSTRRNMDRVQDILAELKPRKKSLERQARRATEFDQIRKDLKEILREWYGYYWHKTQKEYIETRNIAQEQESSLQSSRMEHHNIYQELVSTRGNVNLLRSNLNSWHRQLSDVHSQRELIGKELAGNIERERSLNERKTRLENEIVIAEAEISRRNESILTIEEKISSWTKEFNVLRSQIKEVKEGSELQSSNRTSMEEQIELIRKEIINTSSQKIEFQTKLRETNNRRTKLNALIEDAVLEIEGTKRAFIESQDNLANLKKSLIASESEIEKHAQKLSFQTDEIDKLIKLQSSIQNELIKKETQINKFIFQKELLIKAEKKLIGYPLGAKLLIDAAKQNDNKNIFGILGNHISVPDKYKVAIGAALGNLRHGVLLEWGENRKDILSSLTDHDSKAYLLPIDRIRSSRRNGNEVPDEIILGYAPDLVECAPEFEQVILALLGNVFVVNNSKAALNIVAGNSSNIKAVTLDGQVYYGNGIIEVDASGESIQFDSAAEINQINEKAAAIENEIISLNGELHDLETKEIASRSKLDLANSESDRLNKQFQENSSNLKASVLESDQIRSMINWQEDHLESLINENDSLEQDINSFQNEIVKYEESLQIHHSRLEKKQIQYNELIQEKSDSQTVKLDINIAVIDQSLRDAEITKVDLQLAFDNANHKNQSILAQFENTNHELGDLEKKLTISQASESNLGGDIKTLQSKILPTEIELKEAEEKLNLIDKLEGEARHNLNISEKHNSQSQIALIRKNEELDTLRSKIEDDFGLVEFEYEDEISGPAPLPLGEMVEHLPVIHEISEELENNMKNQRGYLRRMGAVNPEAQTEYQEVSDRTNFLAEQLEDLLDAEKNLLEILAELEVLMDKEFRNTYEIVAAEFKSIFPRLFSGGKARLILTEGDEYTEPGVEIEVRLPGKRMQPLTSLSGGERSLTAVALVLALIKSTPTPFCIMDEVDAALDDSNIELLQELLSEIGKDTQFVLITHNRSTVQIADLIYGITMGKDTTSKIISLKLDEVDGKYSQ